MLYVVRWSIGPFSGMETVFASSEQQAKRMARESVESSSHEMRDAYATYDIVRSVAEEEEEDGQTDWV